MPTAYPTPGPARAFDAARTGREKFRAARRIGHKAGPIAPAKAPPAPRRSPPFPRLHSTGAVPTTCLFPSKAATIKDGAMSDLSSNDPFSGGLGGGLPGGFGGGPDPADALKKKGLPWPVYLAIGIALLAVFGFLGFRSYQGRQKRKLHVAFMEQFADYEKNQVNGFWRCMFGKDGDGRRFNAPEALNAAIESSLFADVKGFPQKVTDECVPKALKAGKAIKDFSPPPPAEYETVLDSYGKAMAGLANTLGIWAEGAPKRIETRLREDKIKTAGETWSTTANVNKADPLAWQYDKFLHCSVPEIDKLKDSQALLDFLASKCINNPSKGQKVDVEFLAKIRDTCIPEAQEAPAKAPATFKGTFNKFASDFDRMSQAWGSCFRKLNKESKKDDLEGFDRAWVEAVNASTAIRKTGAEQLKEE